ncbi:hypothetical protein Desfe_0829 [Desulfurococcus amylolyticus DSM 16532]|uniref:Uncharacterized protein n=1 Tax=Desulfurococcus amylolyticus DSM 16532 TaxID=768672 RepID=I3XRZ6_DESAM|nr:hypothetical protein Desfe_0829 [Desulfurococcus amylolyticus DSM 16532]
MELFIVTLGETPGLQRFNQLSLPHLVAPTNRNVQINLKLSVYLTLRCLYGCVRLGVQLIKYRKNNYVLYPLGKENREKPRKLHGKKVYAVIVVEE